MNNEMFSLDDFPNMDFGQSVIDILLDEDNDDNIILYKTKIKPNGFASIRLYLV